MRNKNCEKSHKLKRKYAFEFLFVAQFEHIPDGTALHRCASVALQQTKLVFDNIGMRNTNGKFLFFFLYLLTLIIYTRFSSYSFVSSIDTNA